MRNSTLKICAMLLAFCTSAIHLQAMDEWDGNTVAQGFYSGTGTETDPYRIFTASQFLYFIQQTRDGNTFNGQYIELCNDISFRTNEGLKNGGDFYGDFDGNDHTIKVDKYEEGIEGYLLFGWHLFNLYGSMHDVLFVRANEVMTIYTGGILYNCRFEFGSYHRNWTVRLEGGTIANCVSDAASSYQYLDSKPAQGFVAKYASDNPYNPHGYCLNCYFPIESKDYNGYTVCKNYYGTIESCGEEAGNDWVQSHTEYDYKSWPLTFNPTYPEYQIKEQPQTYNPSVVCPNSDKALYQWCYQEKMPITFETIGETIEVPCDNMVLSFDFETWPYVTSSYNKDDIPAWISINGEKIVDTKVDIVATYSCQLSAGTCEISRQRSYIRNIRLAYPTEILANETSSVLSKQTIMERPGAYFCQVSYGEGCDVMYSDYVDYEKLLTIDNVTYVINEDATATVLWADDMAERVTIHETVSYDDVDYPVTSISSKAFADCTSLASIKCNTSEVPALLGGTTFEELIPSNVTLNVPASAVEKFEAAAPWYDFGYIVPIELLATDIILSETSATLIEGETLQLSVTIKPEGGSNQAVIWSTTNKNVATVDNNGKVTAIAPGTATIIAKASDGSGVSAQCEVTVEAATYVSITVNQYGSGTYCSKYALDFSSVEGLKAYAAAGYNSRTGVVTLLRLNTSQPGEGIFIKGEPGKYMVPIMESTDDHTINMLVGTLTKTSVNTTSDDGIYANYKYTKKDKDPAPMFYQFTDGSTVSAGKAYLQIPMAWLSTTGEARSIGLRFDEGEGATDIENPEFNIQNSALIYDLIGRKVSAPKKGGIYIVTGKKIVY